MPVTTRLDGRPAPRVPAGVVAVALLTTGLTGGVVAPAAHAAAPTLTKIAPVAAAPGHGLTVTGTGLTGTTQAVFLGGEGADDDVPAASFHVLGPTSVVVQVPLGAASGRVRLTSAAGSVTSLPVTVPQPPVVDALSVASGKGNDAVTMTGAHLTGARASIAGRPAALVPAPTGTDTSLQLTVKVPVGLPGGRTRLVVTSAGGSTSMPFTVAPELKAVVPAVGSTVGGGVALLTGSGLTGVTGVTVGGRTVSDLVAVSDKEVAFRLPPAPAGRADVVLQTTSGDLTTSATLVGGYTYSPIPTVTAVSPDWNRTSTATTSAGTPVTVRGDNLTADTQVLVGTTPVPADRVQVLDGELSFVPPPALKPALSSLNLVNPAPGSTPVRTSVPFTYAGAPTVTRLSPTTGPAGTAVTVTGTSFVGEPAVTFGGTAASCRRTSSTVLVCTAPAGSGAGGVVVRTALGSSLPAAPAAPPAFTHLPGTAPPVAPPARPAVKGLLPSAGVVGATVAVSGSSLQAVTAVEFSGAAAGTWVTAARPVAVSPTRLLVRVPHGAASGPLRLTGADGTAVTTDAVRYLAAARPSVTSVDAVGDATVGVTSGDLVVVRGAGLMVGGTRPVVTVGGAAAPVVLQPAPTDATVVVKVPAGSGGRVPLVVTTPLGSATAVDTLYQLPVVKAVTAVPGSSSTARTGGVAVTVSGTGFTGAHALAAGRLGAVTFGGAPAQQVVVLSDKQLVAVTPPGAAASDPVVVTTQLHGRTGSSRGEVRDLDDAPPTVSAVEPATTLVGSSPRPVTLTGTGLGDTTVSFGRDPATVLSVAEDGRSMVVVPPVREASAVVPVTVTRRTSSLLTGSLPAGFRYQLPVPTVTGVSAATTLAGRTPPAVTITGTFLSAEAQVRFGTDVGTVLSAAPDGRSMVVVPPRRDHAGGVPLTVTDLTFDPPLSGTMTAPFSYVLPVPTPTGLSSSSALAGRTPAAVTVTGRHLGPDAEVRFGTGLAEVQSVAGDGTSMVVVPPRRDTSGDVAVTVTDRTFDPPLTGVLPTPFRYAYPVPAVTALSTSTTLAGRTPSPLTLTGSHLTPDAVVRFGTGLATVTSVAADGTSMVVVPPRRDAAGDVPVTVTNPSFDPPLTGRFAGAFRYLFPTPSAATLSAGTALAGRTPAPITITGTHLGSHIAVRFGTATAAVLSAADDGTSMVVAPPRRDSAGPVPVTLVDTTFDPALTSTAATPFTYVFPTPTVTGISSSTAVASSAPAPVTLTGTHLHADAVVRFGTDAARVVSAADDGTSMVVVPPARTSAARVLVTVTAAAVDPPLTGTLSTVFRYLPVPTLTALDPAVSDLASAPGAVTLTGRNLRLDTLVDFGGAAATVRSAADDGTSLVVVPPARTTAGRVAVSVHNRDGESWSASLADAYEYRLSPATVTGLSVGTSAASTGPAGSTVTIRGTGFVGVTAVRFGTVAAPFTVVDASTVVATVPLTPTTAHGTTVTLTVVNGTGQPSTGSPSAAASWVWDSRPVVTALSASTGAQGTTVTVTGAGFTGATAVRWDSIAADGFTVVDDTRLTAVVPVSPLGGTSLANVTVTARGLLSAAPPTAAADDWSWSTIAAVSSVTTPLVAGTTATVTGRHLLSTRSVTVNGTAVSPTVLSATTLTFVVPTCPSNKLEAYTNKPVVVVNGSGALSTNDTATSHLFSWDKC